MNRPFLTAQVPYGNNGYTVLLSAVTPFRRRLAEQALDAVPTVGAGVRENMIFVCREVSQKDTGRQGAASLIVTNIDVGSMQPSQLENLQRKLDLLIDSLEDLWKAAPQTSGRDCGPVQSTELQQWETDLKLDREIAADQTADASTPIPPRGSRRAWSKLAVTVLLAGLAAVVLWPASAPVDLPIEPAKSADSDTVAAARPAETKAGKSEIPTPPKTVPQRPSLLEQIESKWNNAKGEKNARLAVRTAAEVIKNEEISEIQKQDIRKWLNARFQMRQPVSSDVTGQPASSEMGIQWGQIVADIDRLGSAIFQQQLTTLETKISENVITDPLLNMFQELLDTTWLENIGKIYDTKTQLDFAARSQIHIAFNSMQKPKGPSGWQLPDVEAAISAIDQFRNYQPQNQRLKTSLTSTKELLTELNKIRNLRVRVRISRVPNNFNRQKGFRNGDTKVLELSLLDALHSETLVVKDLDGKDYTVKNCREYIRPLVIGEMESNSVQWRTTANYSSDTKIDVHLLLLEFDPRDKVNQEWFAHRKKTLQLLNDAQKLLNAALQSLPAQPARQRSGSSTVPQIPKGTDHAMP